MALKKKVGRPKGSINKKKTEKDEFSVTKLALNQVEHASKFGEIAMVLNNLTRSINEVVNTSNKANQILAGRIETLEAELEKIKKPKTLSAVKESETKVKDFKPLNELS